MDAALDCGQGRSVVFQARPRGRVRAFFAAFAVLGASAQAHAQAPGDALAGAWVQFLEHADLRAVTASYGILPQLAGIGADEEAERCREHAAALAAAREANPFSTALQNAAQRCTVIAADPEALVRERQRGELLRAFLLADGQGETPQRPILIAAEADATTLVEQSGWVPLYGRYTVGASSGSLPFVAVFFDPQRKRERQLHFDILSLWQKLDREHPQGRYPAFLLGLVERYLEGGVAAGNVGAELAQVTTALGRQEIQLEAAIARIQQLALSGSPAASFELLPLCLLLEDSDACAADAAGMVRPYAERGLAEGMIVMALAAEHRVRGASGRHARQQWLGRASARLGPGVADTAYAQLAISVDPQAHISAGAAAALRRAVRAGHAPAAVMLAQLIRAKRVQALRNESPDRLLGKAARAGSPAAQAQLGLEYLRMSHYAEAWPLLQRAAARQEATALGLLAIGYDSGKVGLGGDMAQALSLYRQAAERGNAGAMRRLGRAYLRAELGLPRDVAVAEAWFLSGAVFGNERAAIELAEIYLSGTQGVIGQPEDGYAVIERLAVDGMEAARLRMATALLLGQGVKANVDAAFQLLLTLEKEGVSAASFRLGQAYEFGQGGIDVDALQARAHYAKAAAAGHPDAMDYYARALYAGRGGPQDRAAALRWWERAHNAGHPPSGNNLAWVRCSSRDPEVRDPIAGTRLVTAALERAASPNLDDTLAACLAASGQFEQAIATERRAMAQAASDTGVDEQQRAAFARRLAQYQRGEAWFED